MAKEFNKKYMHPTRRKLVDMVLHGKEYDSNVRVGYDTGEASKKREIGEIWTDVNGLKWEQRSYGKVQISELSDAMSEVRNWISDRNKCKGETCEKIKYGYTDKKLIRKTGYCSNCLAEKEGRIKLDGMWDWYDRYKISQNMLSHGEDVIRQLEQAYKDVKSEYEVVRDDGTIEKWSLERDPEELKSDILEDITRIQEELIQVRTIRTQAWEMLKDKGYDLVVSPTDI